jgi:hypothetical protein
VKAFTTRRALETKLRLGVWSGPIVSTILLTLDCLIEATRRVYALVFIQLFQWRAVLIFKLPIRIRSS